MRGSLVLSLILSPLRLLTEIKCAFAQDGRRYEELFPKKKYFPKRNQSMGLSCHRPVFFNNNDNIKI
jgi:hypothetical protein